MKSGEQLQLFLRLCLLLVACAGVSHAAKFTCQSPATCLAMAGYVPANATTLRAVMSLFTVDSLPSLLSANNLPSSTPSSHPVPAGSTIRVPFPCNCTDGAGISNGRPVYRVKNGDAGLDAIARNLFNGMVTFQEIAAVSGIPNPDLILVGQRLRIPLPCSCGRVEGYPTVHYAHVVAWGSTVEGIAAEFGTTETTLLGLNGLSDPKKLMAGSVLDVPLRACSSSISNTSLDSSLLVTNGSYALTANNCVQCSCGSTDWQLQCKPSQGVNATSCPSMQCSKSSLFIGNSSALNACQRSVCSYTGYTNRTIMTNLINESTCASPPSVIQPPGNSASVFGLQWWSFALLHLGLLCIGLPW